MLNGDALPPVDVIIPVWNRPDDIRVCLEAIGRQTYPRELMNVLVVDNGSTDHTPDVVRGFAWATLLSEPAPGSYSARNAGIRHGTAPYVAFTDSDCIPEPDWLEKGIATLLQHPDAGVAGGDIRLFQSGADADPLVADYERLHALNQQRMTSANGCMTANWLSPRAVLEERGGFDSSLKSTADSELANRIGQSRKVVFAPQAVVQHPARGTRAELFQKERRTMGGRWQKYAEVSMGGWKRKLAIELAARMKRLALSDLDLRRKARIAVVDIKVFQVQLQELRRLGKGGEPSRD
ncbi:glycosyltransferase [Novosphingobium album (ex Liu et al. 2023)]|uniref:Glycosyltransferase n=1 Tax=Novosphingobium album (ex Liu et al. 2023) TaxID=3031130 RepID=A0ABT5WK82_9SPHN|nr:glycosyltransferase family 2 protein [Novosphingobium album (ex Liu et al. 2023)]MDE8650460.1 glycosyltransferase [Novosphingobium album (ex Liu et al. 2023)]